MIHHSSPDVLRLLDSSLRAFWTTTRTRIISNLRPLFSNRLNCRLCWSRCCFSGLDVAGCFARFSRSARCSARLPVFVWLIVRARLPVFTRFSARSACCCCRLGAARSSRCRSSLASLAHSPTKKPPPSTKPNTTSPWSPTSNPAQNNAGSKTLLPKPAHPVGKKRNRNRCLLRGGLTLR